MSPQVPLSEFGPNLRKILDLIPSSVPRLLLTPPIPDGPTWAASKGIPGLEPNRTEENTAKYAEVAREVAREMKGEGVELVDVWQVSTRLSLILQEKGSFHSF